MKEQIRNDLKNGSTINEVCNKYNLTFKELLKIFKSDFHSYSKPRASKRHKSSTGVKYVYKKKAQKYWIQKGSQFYGYYKTLSDAVAVRNGLVLNDWNKDELDMICQKLEIERGVKHD